VLRLLALVAFLRGRLDFRARLGQPGQPLLATRQFVGDRHTVGDVRLVRRLGLRHQFGHFRLQLRLQLAGMVIRQCAVPAGIGVQLRPVEPHRAQLQHAHLARQQQHLHEQGFDLRQKASSEHRNGVVVRMVIRRDEAERHAVIRRPLQLAAGEHAGRVAIHQHTQQQRRVVRCRTRTAVAPAQRRQIEPVDHLHHEPRQMFLRQPLLNRRWKQLVRVAIERPEIAHGRAHSTGGNS